MIYISRAALPRALGLPLAVQIPTWMEMDLYEGVENMEASYRAEVWGGERRWFSDSGHLAAYCSSRQESNKCHMSLMDIFF